MEEFIEYKGIKVYKESYKGSFIMRLKYDGKKYCKIFSSDNIQKAEKIAKDTIDHLLKTHNDKNN